VLGAPLEIFAPDSGKSSILVMAGQHGEESETIILLSKALRSLELPCAVWVLLCANPDGAQRGTRGNAHGVDLNRNFPTKNWQEEDVYHRWTLKGSQDTPLSTGDTPGSEPETRALIEFITSQKIETIVSLHAPLACIDSPRQSLLARELAKRSNLPLVREIGYHTPGSLGSWCAENNIDDITYEFPADSVWRLLDTHVPILQSLLDGSLQ
jgi:protein MpaA